MIYLEAQQRRLDCLDRAIGSAAGQSAKNLIARAKMFEEYVINGTTEGSNAK